jgi:hypothetical protein
MTPSRLTEIKSQESGVSSVLFALNEEDGGRYKL